MRINVAFVDGADRDLPLPFYATGGAAGADVCANLADRGTLTLAPGARAVVPTGLRMAIPEGCEVQVRPRSGLALKHGVTVVNAPGTIDSDYRGEVGVLLVNLGDMPFVVTHGMRVAQLVAAPVVRADFALGDLDETPRGAGGFGSTGTD
ncbi:deoxyuridine 5'-triphosphate nucleotidohydrolase [Loktanella sp. 3ANDIMAR09]|uniref:dUTP diphosphatase n=1 Tax=Loktanella sp. 3ANDIMAR09 TaxID=1225657 RepID=UPI0006F6619A|nr:dUTP diphosphatase [Loktanella sp. 3ANDIMAR09]KQI69124.1 deoxyuridine 5'-triphosphate nucleotidohydrolase [Loktanella sp. 3ANDIMAR09]